MGGSSKKTFVDVGYVADYNDNLAFTFKDSVALRSVLANQDIMDITLNIIKEGQYSRQKQYYKKAAETSPFGKTSMGIRGGRPNIEETLFTDSSLYIKSVWGIDLTLYADGIDPDYDEANDIYWEATSNYGKITDLWLPIHKKLYREYTYNEYNPVIQISVGDPAELQEWAVIKGGYTYISNNDTDTQVEVHLTRNVEVIDTIVIGQNESGEDITVTKIRVVVENTTLPLVVPTLDYSANYVYGTITTPDISDADSYSILHFNYIKDVNVRTPSSTVSIGFGIQVNNYAATPISEYFKLLPMLPIRTPSNGWLADNNTLGKDIRDLMSYLGSDLDAITDSLKSTGNIYAAVYQLGVPLNSNNEYHKEYLFAFFDRMKAFTVSPYESRVAAKASYDEWIATRTTTTARVSTDNSWDAEDTDYFSNVTIHTPRAPELSYPTTPTVIEIREGGYNIDLGYAYIRGYTEAHSSAEPKDTITVSISDTAVKAHPTDDTYDEDGFSNGVTYDPSYEPHSDLLDGIPRADTYSGCGLGDVGFGNNNGVDIVLKKYVSDTECEVLIVRNFAAISEIKGELYAYTENSSDKPVLIPLALDILQDIKYYSREGVCDRSKQVYAFAAKTKKVQSSFFSFVFSFIFALVLTLIFPPAGGFAWSTVFSTFAMSLAISIAVQVIMTITDNPIIQAIAVVAVLVFSQGQFFGGFEGMTTGGALVFAANVANSLVNIYSRMELERIAEKYEKEYNRYQELIDEQEDTLGDLNKGFYKYLRASQVSFQTPEQFFNQYEMDTTEVALNIETMLTNDVDHMLM